ncbi:MAG: UbiA family prenyltransferase, partial [Chloroflexi bacterium]|nr:UbiA family prenyltransferase [Chloroflexota bacterium]
GAIPPVVGWAAITGGLDLSALYLFAIVFFWTPPHFWALALLIQKDYEKARIPMLPVVAGREETVWQIFAYSLVLVALTLLFAATATVGWVYLGLAAILGAIFVGLAWQLKRDSTTRQARKLYLYSLLYLALLFVVMIADSTISV